MTSLTSPTIASPTFSAISTTSSFDILSRSTSTTTVSDLDDDEIVWSSSDAPNTPSWDQLVSDEDFVLLPRPRVITGEPATSADSGDSTPDTGRAETPNLPVDQLTWSLTALSVTTGPVLQDPGATDAPITKVGRLSGAARRRRKKQAQAAMATDSAPSVSDRPASVATSTRSSRRRGRNTAKVSPKTGLGSRPVVDDASEQASECGEDVEYDTAVNYITKFLSDPACAKDASGRLTLLQSIIVELGLSNAHNALPSTLTAAKAFLKARAFVNIRDYLTIRTQGPMAVRNLLFPTKSALIKDIKRKKNPAPLKSVKESGLQVLLVPCHHR